MYTADILHQYTDRYELNPHKMLTYFLCSSSFVAVRCCRRHFLFSLFIFFCSLFLFTVGAYAPRAFAHIPEENQHRQKWPMCVVIFIYFSFSYFLKMLQVSFESALLVFSYTYAFHSIEHRQFDTRFLRRNLKFNGLVYVYIRLYAYISRRAELRCYGRPLVLTITRTDYICYHT